MVLVKKCHHHEHLNTCEGNCTLSFLPMLHRQLGEAQTWMFTEPKQEAFMYRVCCPQGKISFWNFITGYEFLKSKIGLDLVHGVSCQYFNIWFLNCWNYCSNSELLHTMPWFKIILSIIRERKNTGFLLHLYLFIFLVHVLFYAIKSRTWPIFLIFWIKNH